MSVMLNGCQIASQPGLDAKAIKMMDGPLFYKVQLARCVDGDTAHFLLDGQDEKVRFLSIDTPEIANSSHPLSEPFADLASNYTCEALNSAKKILLQMDPYENKRDQYDRLLAWIWVDDQLLQGKLIENGYAEVAFVKVANLYSLKLTLLQNIAIRKKVGLWRN